MTTLTVIFIVLKLIGVINWSWFMVFIPTIIELLLILMVVIITYIFSK